MAHDPPGSPMGPGPVGIERAFSVLLVAQALVGLVWWATLAASPSVREVFELWPERPEMLDSLLVADLVVIVAGSLAGAWGIETRARWAPPVVAFTAGGLVYVTLYLMVWVAFTGEGAVSLAIMVPPATLTSWAAVGLWRLRRVGSGGRRPRDSLRGS